MANPNKLRSQPTFNPRAATPSALSVAEPQTVTVKAVVDTITNTDGSTRQSPRVVYDGNDNLIPHDDFATVVMTADLVLAIMLGDLEEAAGAPLVKQGTKVPAEFGGQPTGEEEAGNKDRPPQRQQPRQMTPRPAE